jgi:hypothetical protein
MAIFPVFLRIFTEDKRSFKTLHSAGDFAHADFKIRGIYPEKLSNAIQYTKIPLDLSVWT